MAKQLNEFISCEGLLNVNQSAYIYMFFFISVTSVMFTVYKEKTMI